MTLPDELTAILACPRCKGPLELRDEELLCRVCALAYPIQQGVPVLLEEEARPEPAAR